MTATNAKPAKFRGRLFRVERGIRGSNWYSGATYTTLAAAEEAEARFTPYVEGHPAVGPLGVSLRRLHVDRRIGRKIMDTLAAGADSFPVRKQNSESRGLRLNDFYALEELGLVRLSLEESQVQTGPASYRIRSTTMVHLTPAGIAWATGA